MTDKPQAPNLTFASLDSIDKPTPFVYFTKSNKRVTFPDVFDMEFEAAEEFLFDMADKRNSEVLRKWLSDKDYAAIKADRLTLRQLQTLIERVQAHYEGTLGSAGEGDASES